MITKLVYYSFFIAMSLIAMGCGQQESFYGLCNTQDGYTYKIQQGATACPWAQSVDVPASERLGY